MIADTSNAVHNAPSLNDEKCTTASEDSDVETDCVEDPDYLPSSDSEKSYEPLQLAQAYGGQENTHFNPPMFDKQAEVASSFPVYKDDEFLRPTDACTAVSTSEFCVEESVSEKPEASEKEEVETVNKPNYKDKKVFCIFCEKDVLHFARHLTTWHSTEIEVVRLSFGDKQSKRVQLSNLRKRGNFIANRTSATLRPVKRLKAGKTTVKEDFLPCSHCLGFYKRKSLYRHTKVCTLNVDKGNKNRQTSQSDGQTALLLGSLVKYDELLKTKLFSRMQADSVALVVKKDPIICKYAYAYIKGRKTKGNLDTVRQNVRRLGKLVQFAQQRNPDITSLLDLLRPYHFTTILEGVNEMAKYNSSTERYESPTLAINFGTLLKKVCKIASNQLFLVRNTEEQRKDLAELVEYIKLQWADEVSAQACSDLNENKWNKQELLPLTTDLKKLNDQLTSSAENVYNKVKSALDAKSYYELKDLLYTLIILLNRRRPAEVAQLKVHTYRSVNLDATKEDVEFGNCLTETERILLNTYSRFVIRGKRGRGVPVLLSPTMRKHFEYLISIRDNFVTDNDYIFHTKGQGFIDGTKVIRKHVKKCGVERPNSITATLLRKHLATITQLLHFSNTDMEQLSKFMGHTLKTHCSVYRMSDDMYQTAKVSKLLLLMMEGGADKFKGKRLDEIDIPLTATVDNEVTFDNVLQATTTHSTKEYTVGAHENDVRCTTKLQLLRKGNTMQRCSWTDEQKRIIVKHFGDHIKKKEAPKRGEVQQLVDLYPDMFKERKWTSIKAVVYNIYSGKLNVK